MVKPTRLTIGYLGMHASKGGNSLELLRGISHAAKDYDVNLLHINGGKFLNDNNEFKISNLLYKKFLTDPFLINKHNFDGLIIWEPSLYNFLSHSEISLLLKSLNNLPVINIAGVVDGIPSILMDNYTSTKSILKHLIGHHGFTKIGFIQGEPGHHYSDTRLKAYYDTLKEHKIPLNPDLIPPGTTWTPNAGRKAGNYLFIEKKLKPQKDIEAIAAASDQLIIGLIDVLHKKKYSVPKDIALAGFNNKTEGRAMVPALSTIDPFFFKQGYTAVEKLCTLIQGGNVEPENYIPAEVIIRQSCGCFSQLVDNSQLLGKEADPIKKTRNNYRIINRKEDIFKNILSELNNYNYEFNISELKKVFDLLINDIVTSSSNEFLRSYERYLSHNNHKPLDLYFLNDSISFFKKCVSPYLVSFLHIQRCEDLLQQARIMVSLAVSCSVEIIKRDYLKNQFEIVTLDHQINSVFNIKKLTESLKSIFQDLEILDCYIFIYPEENRHYIKEKHIFCFEKNNSYHIVGNHRIGDNYFYHLLPCDKRISSVIKPLTFHDTLLGIILFRAEKEIDTYLLETLRGTINVALVGAIVIEEREKIQVERDRLYEEAVQANKVKNEFLANMSHEIRTPLNAVLGLNYLMEQTDLNDTQKQYVNKIEYSAQLLIKHINDLLDFSKIEAGKMTLDSVSFNLSDSLKNLLDMIGTKSQGKGLRLNFSFSEDIPDMLIGDKFKLEQVLMNLLINAIKFTDKGEVNLLVSLISRSEYNAEIKFLVKDTGIGLSQEQQKKLFKPFTQADTSITRKFGGTGLGLSISRSIVTLLGGEIGLESEIDKGSTFFFTLNFKIDKKIYPQINKSYTANPEDMIHEGEHVNVKVKDKNILIVEDNTINMLVAKEILKSTNANIITAENGQEAVNVLSNNKISIHLILMDLHMPTVDGFSATLSIRELPGCKNIPIIALTADGMAKSRQRIFDVGMNDYLTKPFSPEILYKKIYQWACIKNNKTSIAQNKGKPKDNKPPSDG